MLPPRPDHEQLLIALNNSYVRTLLDDKTDFHVVVIGAPPGIHRTVYVLKFSEFGLHMLILVQRECKGCRGDFPVHQNQAHTVVLGGSHIYHCQGYHQAYATSTHGRKYQPRSLANTFKRHSLSRRTWGHVSGTQCGTLLLFSHLLPFPDI